MMDHLSSVAGDSLEVKRRYVAEHGVVLSNDTRRIQKTHNLIGHIGCELVEIMLFPQADAAQEMD